MSQLFSRFAWVLSILLAFITPAVFNGRFDEDLIFLSIILSFLIKYFIFPQRFLSSALNEMNLDKRVVSSSPTQENNRTTGSIQENNLSAPLFGVKDTKEPDFLDEDDFIPLPPFPLEGDSTTCANNNTSNTSSLGKKVDSSQDSRDNPFSYLFGIVQSFFAENLLAKLGGILVFLGVLFLLNLVYSVLGPVSKIILGFFLGFGVYAIGIWLEKTNYKNESYVLLGLGILINYLVILAGRYLIGDSYSASDTMPIGVLSDSVTFFFLILNTIFGVITSFVYKSRTLLLFSFLFAYLNPFLVGGLATTPYLPLGYMFVITFAGYFIAHKNQDYLLFGASFVLGNVLALSAPINTSGEWILTLLSSVIISFFGIFGLYHNYKNGSLNLISFSKYLPSILLGAFVFVILHIANGNIFLDTSASFITYFLILFGLAGVTLFFIVSVSLTSLFALLFAPLLILIFLLFSGIFLPISAMLAGVILFYVGAFSFLQYKLSVLFSHIFFILLGIFLFLTSGFLGFSLKVYDMASFYTIIMVAFIFVGITYYFSTKENLSKLYFIGTLFGILLFSPILIVKGTDPVFGNMVGVSVISLIIFAFMHWGLPFVNPNFSLGKNVKNLVLSSVLGVLFLGAELFRYGTEYFPGVTTGYAFVGLAIIYFIFGYSILQKGAVSFSDAKFVAKDTLYTYLGISLSLFSLAIAIVFSSHPEIISLVWLFEACILFFFFARTDDNKLYITSMILFIIGVINLSNLSAQVEPGDFIFLVPFLLIFLTFAFNVHFLDILYEKKQKQFILHNVFHVIGIAILAFLLAEIIPSTRHGWSTLGIILFTLPLSYLYVFHKNGFLKIFFFSGLSLFLISHFSELSWLFQSLENEGKAYFKFLDYFSTIILGGSLIIWSLFEKQKKFTWCFRGIYLLYLFSVTSFYIYDLTNTIFSLTLYWAIISFVLIARGLQTETRILRTFGLYLVLVIACKIFFYDIWYEIDDAVFRVIALMTTGAIFIVISTFYSRKLGGSLKGEFRFPDFSFDDVVISENTSHKNGEEDSSLLVTKYDSIAVPSENKKDMKTTNFNSLIEKVDIGDVSSIRFETLKGVKFLIKSKNLLKITLFVLGNMQKTEFSAGELQSTYDYIVKHFSSSLPQKEYDKICSIMNEFVKYGGNVIVNRFN